MNRFDPGGKLTATTAGWTTRCFITAPARGYGQGLPCESCAMGIMAKVPRSGYVKTRLVPPLTHEQATLLSQCFLRDVAASIARAADAHPGRIHGLAVYLPQGEERAFDGLLPQGFRLLLQRGEDLGERLFHASEDLLSAGFHSVCLVNAARPTARAHRPAPCSRRCSRSSTRSPSNERRAASVPGRPGPRTARAGARRPAFPAERCLPLVHRHGARARCRLLRRGLLGHLAAAFAALAGPALRGPAAAAAAPLAAPPFDGRLPICLGREGPGGGNQSLSIRPGRARAEGPARRAHLSPDQPARIRGDDLSARSPALLSCHDPPLRVRDVDEVLDPGLRGARDLDAPAPLAASRAGRRRGAALRLAPAGDLGIRRQRARRRRGHRLRPRGAPRAGARQERL